MRASGRKADDVIVLLATKNRGKLKELAGLFAGSPIELKLPADVGAVMPEVEETGATFEENALLKARALSAASGYPALADDSGLEVDAIGGAPGVRSARFAGAGASERDNCDRLLAALKSAPPPRSGRFRCALALTKPGGETLTAAGILEGEIPVSLAGENGFGYDPVFYLPRLGKTVAELSPEEKGEISHRARAAVSLKRNLGRFLSTNG